MRVICFLLCACLVLAAIPLARQTCTTPFDISGHIAVPDWLRATKEADAIAFPAHENIARALRAAQCPPSVSGLQWIKAAAHARSPAENEKVIDGLRADVRRSASDGELAQELCPFVQQPVREQRQDLETAGLPCSTSNGSLRLQDSRRGVR